MLDVWYPAPRLGDPHRRRSRPEHLAALEGVDDAPRSTPGRRAHRRSRTSRRRPTDTADAWLRLHLLSHRLVAPRTINLDGIFGLLTNVVWTSAGPCAVEGFERHPRPALAAAYGRVSVFGVDKFPRMTDYVAALAACASPTPTGSGSAPTSPTGHDRDARGLRQLQRRHAGRLDGRGPDQRRRRRRGRLRRRRRRIDHGHAVRRRQGGHLRRSSAACSARTPASASRWATTASSRPAATSPPASKVLAAATGTPSGS